jgi:hypothetical protein
MNENAIGKEVVDAAGKAHRELGPGLGFVLNFGANLMKDGIERVVNGFPEENLGVLASWRETEARCPHASSWAGPFSNGDFLVPVADVSRSAMAAMAVSIASLRSF